MSLERYKAELQKLLDAPPVDKKRMKLKKDLLELTKKRVAIAKDYTVSYYILFGWTVEVE